MDAQDNQDATPLHGKPNSADFACGFADVQDDKPAVSRKNPVNPVHPCKQNHLPTRDFEPVSGHQTPAFVSGQVRREHGIGLWSLAKTRAIRWVGRTWTLW